MLPPQWLGPMALETLLVIWPLLRAGIYWGIGAVQTGAEFLSSGRKLVRQMRKGLLPLDDDTDPVPLPHRDAERIAEFGRRAGHEDAYKNAVSVNDTLTQPIPKAPRVPKI